jgi:hypothetical protein
MPVVVSKKAFCRLNNRLIRHAVRTPEQKVCRIELLI